MNINQYEKTNLFLNTSYRLFITEHILIYTTNPKFYFMKTQNIIFSILLVGFTIASCKKKGETPGTNTGGGGTPGTTSNSYVFDGVTYTGSYIGWRHYSSQFEFYYKDTSAHRYIS